MFSARKNGRGGDWPLHDAMCLMVKSNFEKKKWETKHPQGPPVPTPMQYIAIIYIFYREEGVQSLKEYAC